MSVAVGVFRKPPGSGSARVAGAFNRSAEDTVSQKRAVARGHVLHVVQNDKHFHDPIIRIEQSLNIEKARGVKYCSHRVVDTATFERHGKIYVYQMRSK